MALLALSLLALALGPLLVRVIRPHGPTARGFDAFVAVTIAGLVLLHVVPEAVRLAGWPAATCVAAGVAAPLFVHRLAPSLERLSPLMAVLGLVALATHGMLDGFALRTAELEPQLAAAVVLHRIPLGLGMWWLGETHIGRRAAVLVLATEAVAQLMAGPALHCLQAFMAGMVLHVVAGHDPGGHTHGHDAPTPDDGTARWVGVLRGFGWPTVVGALAGLSSLAVMHFLE
jgi:hypothetical protein